MTLRKQFLKRFCEKILIRNMKQRPHENKSLLNASLYLGRVAGALSEHPDNPKSADDPN